jgi:hypothetical protein
MTVATTSCLFNDYWSHPVRLPPGRQQGFALFCAHRERENSCDWNTTNPTINLNNPVTSDFATPYQKIKTQIPIARLPSMAAWLRPAVSSLEACTTPAH